MKIILWDIVYLDQFRMKKVRFYRELELPFVPFVGLEFSLDDGNFEATIRSISWNGECLDCWCGKYDEGRSRKEVIEAWNETGWKVED